MHSIYKLIDIMIRCKTVWNFTDMLNKLIYLVLIMVLFGCAGLDTKPEDFKVNISTMQMLESTLMEQRFLVTLRIMNRSKEDFIIEGMSFDIELNDRDFASGVTNEQVKLDRFSETVVSVTVTSTIFGIIRQINGLQQQKSKAFKYNLSGHIYTKRGLLGVPFSENGEINLTPSTTGSDTKLHTL